MVELEQEVWQEETIYRPKSIGYFVMLFILLSFILAFIYLLIASIVEKKYAGILVSVAVFILFGPATIKLLLAKVVIGKDYVIAPQGENDYSRYNKLAVKMPIKNIENVYIVKDIRHLRRYIYIMVRCKEMGAKFDIKLFSEKQVEKMMTELSKKIIS